MPNAPETAQTLSRGLDVLMLLAATPTGLSPSQIAADLGLSRSIIYRLVSTLVDYNLVRRGADGQLTVGLGALRLTENLHPSLREATRDVLEVLAEEAHATAHFVVADGDEALAVAVVEPQRTTFHVGYRVGSRTPLGVGAIGRALLAAREGHGGVFASEGELIPGAYGVVVPVLNMPGIVAAVGVVTLAGAATETTPASVEKAASALEDMFAAT